MSEDTEPRAFPEMQLPLFLSERKFSLLIFPSQQTGAAPRPASPFGSRRLPIGFSTAGITGAAALAVSFGAVHPAHAQVTIYSSGLTNVLNGSNIYFSPSTGVSSLTTFPGYQYSLSSNNAFGSAAGISGPTNGTVSSLVKYQTVGMFSCASRLAAGDLIDGSGTYTASPGIANSGVAGEPWDSLGQGYLALELQDSATSNMFYGWADITVNPSYTVTLNRFGVNATPNQAVTAGQGNVVGGAVGAEPDALALLALGATGMGAYRLRLNKRKKDAE